MSADLFTSEALRESLFTPLIDPGHIARELSLGTKTADPWQARLLASTAPYRFVLKPRRVGGSEWMVWEVCRVLMRGQLAVLLAPSERQALLLLRRVRRAMTTYAGSGRPGADRYKPVNSSVQSLLLANGGEAVALPGTSPDNIRGYDEVMLIAWDEIAHHAIADSIWEVALHMIDPTKGGRVVAATTAGAIGSLAHRIHGGTEDGWESVHVTVAECTRAYSPEREALVRKMAGAAQAVELDGVWRAPGDQHHLWTPAQADQILYGTATPETLPGEEPLPDRVPRDNDQPRAAAIWSPDVGLIAPEATSANPASPGLDKTGISSDPLSSLIPRQAGTARRRPVFAPLSD